MVRIGSFNVFGMGGRDVGGAVDFATTHAAPDEPELSAIGFQEVWQRQQLRRVLDAYPGSGASEHPYANVRIWRQGDGAWRCVVPHAGSAPSLELGSGLALCVRGPIDDAFFLKYRGGEIPDRFAKKGILAVLVRTPGQPKRAILNTHLHDYSNDGWGRARWVHLDTIASAVNWIRANWQVPVVLVGDFNIDSKRAYDRSDDVERTLYGRLVRIGLPTGDSWWDVNARANSLSPELTNDSRAIDHHLIWGETSSGATFSVLPTSESDHHLTLSAW